MRHQTLHFLTAELVQRPLGHGNDGVLRSSPPQRH
jgi:hypothetical protein